MSKREPKLLLSDIRFSIEKIKAYTEGHSFDTFIEDSKTLDAVIRNFEIIGEAANRLPEDFKDAHNGVIGLGSGDLGIVLSTTIWV